MATTTTTCADCGASVDRRGLTAHRAGMACLTATNARRATERGLVRIDGRQRGFAAAHPLTVRVADAFMPGGPRKRARLEYHYYAPAWLAVVLAAASTREDGPRVLRECVLAGKPVGDALAIIAAHRMGVPR